MFKKEWQNSFISVKMLFIAHEIYTTAMLYLGLVVHWKGKTETALLLGVIVANLSNRILKLGMRVSTREFARNQVISRMQVFKSIG